MDFRRDFTIRLVQAKKEIPARSTEVSLLHSDTGANPDQISGAIIELRFNIHTIDSYDDATVKVHTPDDQDVETTFDLGHLHRISKLFTTGLRRYLRVLATSASAA
jgi:hypothetical protein